MASGNEPISFEEFVTTYFDRDVPDNFSDLINEDRPGDDLPDPLTVQYLTRLFSRSGELLASYTDDQVTTGLMSLNFDEMYFSFHRGGWTNWSQRRAAFLSIYTLFEQVFASRCSPCLCHLNEPGANSLNDVCYMWWERHPVWGDYYVRSSELNHLETRSVENWMLLHVIERILYLDADACKESALHGLNHWSLYCPEEVRWIIDGFLECYPDLRPELREYALDCREGRRQ